MSVPTLRSRRGAVRRSAAEDEVAQLLSPAAPAALEALAALATARADPPAPVPGEGLLPRIARVVAAIPHGRVATYGQVAAQAGNARAARQVAWALRVYAGRGLPWHRVLGAGGVIRLPQGNGLERQRALLRAEGVAVDGAGHVDLAAYRWRP